MQANSIVARFREELASNSDPDLADFLKESSVSEHDRPNSSSDLLCGLIAAEVAFKSARGEDATPADYEARLPEHAEDIHRAFATLPLHPGYRLGDYVLQSPIGRGGMGEVWRATDNTGRTVALKVVRSTSDADEDEDRLHRFRREFRILAGLENDHIVRLYHASIDKHRLFFTMQLVEGTDLSNADRVASTVLGDTDDATEHREPIGADTAADYILDAAKGITAAHRCGIIHRDIKPGNLFVTETQDGGSRVLVGDFGLAMTESESETEAIAGTPGYMAPEQRQGLVTTASDIYGLGATLFALLVGRPPRKPAEFSDTVQSLTDQPVPDIPADLAAICLKMIRLDPSDRYESAAHVVEDLRRYQTGLPVSARPLGLAAQGMRLAKRHKPATGLLVASIAFLVLAATLFVRGQLADIRYARNLADSRQRELKKATEMAARASYDAFTLARQRGEWSIALETLEQAEALGWNDPVAIKIDKVHLLTSMHRVSERQDLLTELLADPAGSHAGEILLLQGEGNLVIGKHAEGVSQVQEALRLGLPPGRKAFAESLLAETVPEAISHLETAAEHLPYDLSVLSLLGTELLLAGRTDDAKKVAFRIQTLFPNDTNGSFLEALAHAVSGDADLATQALKQGTSQTAELRKQMLAVVELFDAIRQALVNESQTAMVAALLKGVQVAASRPSGQSQPTGMWFGVPPRHSVLISTATSALGRSMLPFGKKGAQQSYAEVVRINPEATMILLMAHAHQDDIGAVEKYARQAATAPAILSEVAPYAWTLAARAAFIQATEDRQAVARASEYADNRRSFGPLSPIDSSHFAIIYDRAGRTRLATRLALDAVEAEPANTAFLQTAIQITSHDKHYTRCLSLLDKLDELKPGSKWVRDNRENILKAAREQLGS